MTQIKAVDSSSLADVPTYGQTHELFLGLSIQATNIQQIKQRLDECEKIYNVTQKLCDAYSDLHNKRIVYLFSTVPLILIITLLIIIFSPFPIEEYKAYLNISLFVSIAIFFIQLYYVPNKIKMLSDDIKRNKDDISSSLSKMNDMTKSITELKKILDEKNEVKKRPAKKK
ncbi:hypothetical protein [Desulfomicrobium baculatum]|uniref:Uncharacterized protein n=1 Tax=Desulfomicrobium baculatum (strain DSM 4028 / VKM B-1378 / X) TaxID=525897 RepID=C7LNI2_DESBD|nr:hypothetical protein [Desulfomicrobium baculatum]ACU88867.1 hypothetical protein Dbac_0746 [Desulfomicrobium baculatum DSM 4028]